MSRFIYKGGRTNEISFPLGGIGTGCIGLAGNGRLIDWEVFNRPNKGSLNGFSHFAVKAEQDGVVLDARVLHGDLHPPHIGDLGVQHGGSGFGFGPRRGHLAGVPHLREVEFRGEFPIANLKFKGGRFPARVTMTAFNPFIPLNDKDSGLPAAFFEIEVKNTTKKTITYTVVGALSNPLKKNNINTFRKAGGISMLHLASDAYQGAEFDRGDLTLATDAADVSVQQYWFKGGWFDELEVYWRELTAPGRFGNRRYTAEEAPEGATGLLAAHIKLRPGGTETVRFVISWSFPNCRKYWARDPDELARRAEQKHLSCSWKNYYATIWKDSKSSARYALKNWDRLYGETLLFKDALFCSDLPAAALEAVSANISILKSPTVMRLADGTFYGWEGCREGDGCCEGSCTHVWNYAQAMPFLFPKLERSMREANYKYNQDPDGGMRFRLQLPLGIGRSDFRPCADGQFGDVIKTYRDWKVCGDDDWLRKLWPKIRKSIEYAWSRKNPDRWDPEKTGVLWGRQHHTLDVELFGPNSWLTGYYLAALKAAAEMASHLGERAFADELIELFARGKKWADKNLFNGEYYHQLIDLKDRSIAKRFDAMQYWNAEHKELKYQIGEGSEIDQIIAQWHANLYGLGEIFDPKQVRTALKSIFKYNFRPRMREHFNACRVYALNDEAGLVVCHWPEGRYRPMTPLPYAGETQNGYEWAACVQMIQAGLVKEGTRCVQAIRDRYDGLKRNPWNEFECGSNYARSMASYSLLNAFSGFQFDMTRGMIGFDPVRPEGGRFRCFWSLDSAWGRFVLTPRGLQVRVLRGTLALKCLSLPARLRGRVKLVALNGKAISFSMNGNCVMLKSTSTIRQGAALTVNTR